MLLLRLNLNLADTKKFTEEEAHRRFAATCFNQIWPLLEKPNRTEKEDRMMIHLAHASHYHWLQVGEPINEQRGEWMLARVYTVLGEKSPALKHAKHCLELTEQNGFKDFDLGYAYEGMARALALNGQSSDAKRFKDLAKKSSAQIKKKEDKKLFLSDLKGGEWFGLK